jgi:hypothetical protein
MTSSMQGKTCPGGRWRLRGVGVGRLRGGDQPSEQEAAGVARGRQYGAGEKMRGYSKMKINCEVQLEKEEKTDKMSCSHGAESLAVGPSPRTSR